MRDSSTHSKIRKGLKIYTIVIFSLIIFIPIAFFLFNKTSAATPCSGNIGSGQECNALGNPGPGKTWSCLPDSGSSTSYSCQTVNYSSCTYTRPDGSIGDCGCVPAYQRCIDKCKAMGPGYHQATDTCNNCGQNVGCDCTNDTPTTPTPTVTTTPVDQCPYNEAVVRFQKNATQPWASTVDVVCGESFRVGALHTANGSILGNNAELYINGTKQTSNLITINTPANVTSGVTYNVEVKVRRPSGGYYPENRCNDIRSVTCRVQPNIKYSIVKTVESITNNGVPVVTFKIVMTNNSPTYTIGTPVPFRDVFDSLLKYQSAVGTSTSLGRNVNIPFTQSGNTVSIDDLTKYLGNLAPGQSYTIHMKFLATPGSGCNTSYWNPNNLGEQSSRACVNITTTPPDTDL